MSTWIDFKELRQQLRFTDLLRHYNVVVKVHGRQATGMCPLPTHPKNDDGRKHSASLSVNLERDCFQCFAPGCHAAGNALDFAVMMEGFNPSDRSAFRRGAIRVKERFKLGTSSAKPRSTVRGRPRPSEQAVNKSLDTLVNPPLDFELKDLDENHPYFADHALSVETVRNFGLGFTIRGTMKGRIAIPLHDLKSQLIGYAGLLPVDPKAQPADNSVKLPADREHKGILHRFQPSLLVYNAHRIGSVVTDLIIVPTFQQVWTYWQAGNCNTVCLFTSTCSTEQSNVIERLTEPDAHITIVGWEGNREWMEHVLSVIAKTRFCKTVIQPSGVLRKP